jgi:hypothetical protein
MFDLDFDAIDELDPLSSNCVLNKEGVTIAACPPFISAREVTGEARGGRTSDGKTTFGLTPVGLDAQFLGIRPSASGRVAVSPPEF